MRLHLPTLLSTLLAGSLLQYAAVSIPLRSDGPRSRGLDIAGKEVFNNWTLIDVPIAGRAAERQYEDELPGDSDDTDVNLEEEAKHLSWRRAVDIGRRNIAKLDNPQPTIPKRGYEPYTMFYQDDMVDEDDCGQGQGDDDDYMTMGDTGFYPEPMLRIWGIPSVDQLIISKLIYSKEHDLNPPDQQIRTGEIMLQVWDKLARKHDKRAAEDNGVEVVYHTYNELEWIVRSRIVNEATQKILRLAAKRLKGEDYKNTLIRVTREDNPEESNALSGTPNCRGVYLSLANHDLGRFRDRRVSELLIWKGFGLRDLIAMKIERLPAAA
ncbi:hypothetical protein BJY01DRAFT_246691 [Aspergillus pseudoustus]|uniref:Uncharacterized protein n=1 Tax=Aspergillus pseudoustus TaxID=1810923 RepID=A0ABR4K652_9EURO